MQQKNHGRAVIFLLLCLLFSEHSLLLAPKNNVYSNGCNDNDHIHPCPEGKAGIAPIIVECENEDEDEVKDRVSCLKKGDPGGLCYLVLPDGEDCHNGTYKAESNSDDVEEEETFDLKSFSVVLGKAGGHSCIHLRITLTDNDSGHEPEHEVHKCENCGEYPRYGELLIIEGRIEKIRLGSIIRLGCILLLGSLLLILRLCLLCAALSSSASIAEGSIICYLIAAIFTKHLFFLLD